MYVGNIGSDTENVKVEDLVSGVSYDSDSLDIGNDVGSGIEKIKVEGPIELGDDKFFGIVDGTDSSEGLHCSHMTTLDAMYLNHHVVMAENSRIPSSMA